MSLPAPTPSELRTEPTWLRGRLDRAGRFLRENGVAVGAGLLLLAGVGVAARFVSKSRDAPRPSKVHTITGVLVRQEPPKPPPPPPKELPRQDEPPPQERLVEVKSTDIPPPPAARAEPAAGPLALAGEATGEGDSFQLAANASGRDVRGPGKIGEGEGGGAGDGTDPAARYGYYFGRIATQIQGAFQRSKKLQYAEARVEIKIWVDPTGEVSRVQLLRSTGDDELDRAIEAVRGLKLRDALPPDLPNPAVYRFTARKTR